VPEGWWRRNRPKAPDAIREEIERAASIISIQPAAGARALNVSLPGVRRVHLARVRYYLYYWLRTDPERIEILAFWHESRGSGPPL
jgi:plasmid stabilization system protein ParE